MTTSALVGRAYLAAVQVGSALHMMAVLQVFQVKPPLCTLDESGPSFDPFKELHTAESATDLALHGLKATVQANSKTMANHMAFG